MDKLIIGAGLYGLYCGPVLWKKGQQVEVLEIEQAPFTEPHISIRPEFTWATIIPDLCPPL